MRFNCFEFGYEARTRCGDVCFQMPTLPMCLCLRGYGRMDGRGTKLIESLIVNTKSQFRTVWETRWQWPRLQDINWSQRSDKNTHPNRDLNNIIPALFRALRSARLCVYVCMYNIIWRDVRDKCVYYVTVYQNVDRKINRTIKWQLTFLFAVLPNGCFFAVA